VKVSLPNVWQKMNEWEKEWKKERKRRKREKYEYVQK
jgi:hypothetical protein